MNIFPDWISEILLDIQPLIFCLISIPLQILHIMRKRKEKYLLYAKEVLIRFIKIGQDFLDRQYQARPPFYLQSPVRFQFVELSPFLSNPMFSKCHSPPPITRVQREAVFKSWPVISQKFRRGVANMALHKLMLLPEYRTSFNYPQSLGLNYLNKRQSICKLMYQIKRIFIYKAVTRRWIILASAGY